MKRIKFLTAAGFAGAALTIVMPAQVLAWHPVGKITKFVANETTGSKSVDANTAAEAVTAKPGDVIRYTITIRNDGKADSRGYNDLAFVQLTDTPPAGLTPTGAIKQDIPGVIVPGKSIVKEFRFTVTDTKDGNILKNTACFTGDSTVKDNKQQGCDVAYVKIVNPKTPEQPKIPEQPKTPETPKETPKQPELPTQLPSTGAEAILGTIAGTGAVGYAVHSYRRSKDALKKTLR